MKITSRNIRIITACLVFIFIKSPARVYSIETEVKFEDSTMAVAPKVWISLPNGVVDIAVKEKIANSDTIFKLKYDFFDNTIQATFDFNLWFESSFFGIGLSDRVDFDEIISNFNYTIRSRTITPHYDWLLTRNVRLRAMLIFEDRYVASIMSNWMSVDQTKDVRGATAIIYDSLIDTPQISKGIRSIFELTGPVSIFGTDYAYIQADLNVTKAWQIYSRNKLKFDFKMGYPAVTLKRPPEPRYRAGGYGGMLRGYGDNQFSGNGMIYGVFNYRIPFKEEKIKRGSNTSIRYKSFDLGFEFGKFGEQEIFNTIENFKGSFYAGINCNLVIFRNVDVGLDIIFAKAIDPLPLKYNVNMTSLIYMIEPPEE